MADGRPRRRPPLLSSESSGPTPPHSYDAGGSYQRRSFDGITTRSGPDVLESGAAAAAAAAAGGGGGGGDGGGDGAPVDGAKALDFAETVAEAHVSLQDLSMPGFLTLIHTAPISNPNQVRARAPRAPRARPAAR